jgi:List-Bact-rpt repeat protein
MRLALLGLAVAAAAVCVVGAQSGTAPPVNWCGPGPSTTDLPDVVGGKQIHVIYATPTGSPDRFGDIATGIATDLTAVDAWWRRQDPTRTLRFDLGAFSCSGLGALDISDVKLPQDSTYFDASASRLTRVRDDLVAAGFANADKKYLVYYDQAQTMSGSACGTSTADAQGGGVRGYAAIWIAPNLEGTPQSGGCGNIENPDNRGGYTALSAAHELIHDLGALDTAPGPPHRCPGDPLHPCDDKSDILSPAGSSYWLDDTVLDFGHDDYYAHSGTWWDVQDSPWLRHLDGASYVLHVTVGTGGATVTSDVPGVTCAPGADCTSTWDSGAQVTLTASPAPGYGFVQWTGSCTGGNTYCQLQIGANSSVAAVFAQSLAIASFATTLTKKPLRLSATLGLSRPPGSGDSAGCHVAGGLPVVSSSLRGAVAHCTWALPDRLRGHSLRGGIELDHGGSAVLIRHFVAQIPR